MPTLVRQATPADTDDLVSILADGFSEDPLLVWIYQTDEQYRRLAPIFFRWMVERTLQIGGAYIVEGKGALLGQPSSTVKMDEEQERLLERQLRTVGAECADNLLAFMNAAHRNHPMEVPHWYGTFLAVRAEHRSQAVGVSLLRHCLKEKDTSFYGEATTSRNLALYERLGFRSIGPFTVADEVLLTRFWWGPSGG